MASVNTGATTISFGSTLRIGYRIYGTTAPFTYLSTYPTYDELPYTFTLAAGTWEIEYTQICPNCSTPKYSTSATTVITVS